MVNKEILTPDKVFSSSNRGFRGSNRGDRELYVFTPLHNCKK